jgi:hypothetical protein
MTSNRKRMLQGAAILLTMVGTAAGARAEKADPPPADAPAAPPAAAPEGPSGFGDGGQLVLSVERLFGYTYAHPSVGNSFNTFTLFADSLGAAASPYDFPTLSFDAFVTKQISIGLAGSFLRLSSNGASLSTFEIAPRVGYSMMLGPWLAFWPRLGVTYVYSSAPQKYLGLTVDGLLAILASPHVMIPFGPTVNIGLTGTDSPKYTTAGLYFGLAVLF